jgi:uroporphyrin-III C-methyltransferase
LENLDEIVEVFKKHKTDNYPIAIIQNGTLANEKIAKGNLNNIQQLVQQEQITSPAIIIIPRKLSDAYPAPKFHKADNIRQTWMVHTGDIVPRNSL